MTVDSIESAEYAWNQAENGQILNLEFRDWPRFSYKLLTPESSINLTLFEIDGLASLPRAIVTSCGTNDGGITRSTRAILEKARFEFKKGSSEATVNIPEIINAVNQVVVGAKDLQPHNALTLIGVSLAVSVPLMLVLRYRLEMAREDTARQRIEFAERVLNKCQSDPILKKAIDGVFGGIGQLLKKTRPSVGIQLNEFPLDDNERRILVEGIERDRCDSGDIVAGRFVVSRMNSSGSGSYKTELLEVTQGSTSQKRLKVGVSQRLDPIKLIKTLRELNVSKNTFSARIRIDSGNVGRFIEFQGKQVRDMFSEERKERNLRKNSP